MGQVFITACIYSKWTHINPRYIMEDLLLLIMLANTNCHMQ